MLKAVSRLVGNDFKSACPLCSYVHQFIWGSGFLGNLRPIFSPSLSEALHRAYPVADLEWPDSQRRRPDLHPVSAR
jgi:hypothetical protein